ncbi:MAG: peptidoglycan bridge formation glycyltransferase FemA/FemB family protein, partial [Staphylococcus simulans]|nr:peptidoglycan bridge formation glycyltransferase FemA/FemB family protein [Staphylococcus simulans]
KRGFNVQIEELIGDFYKPIQKVKYWIFNTLNNIRQKVKK